LRLTTELLLRRLTAELLLRRLTAELGRRRERLRLTAIGRSARRRTRIRLRLTAERLRLTAELRRLSAELRRRRTTEFGRRTTELRRLAHRRRRSTERRRSARRHAGAGERLRLERLRLTTERGRRRATEGRRRLRRRIGIRPGRRRHLRRCARRLKRDLLRARHLLERRPTHDRLLWLLRIVPHPSIESVARIRDENASPGRFSPRWVATVLVTQRGAANAFAPLSPATLGILRARRRDTPGGPRMSRSFRRFSLLAITSASLIAGCEDSQQQPPVATDGIYATDDGGALTAPSSAPARDVVTDFLRANGRGTELATLDLVTDRVDAHTGLTHVRLEQRVDGLRVVGGYIKATLDAQGQLIHVIDRLAPAPTASLLAPRISETVALEHAMAHLAIVPDTRFQRAPTVEPIAYVDADGQLRAGYLVETWQARKNLLNHTIVDGGGKVVSNELRTNADAYNVFVEDPLKGGQTVVNGASGWLGTGAQTTANISGNNAHAYLDANADNAPDSGGASVTDGNFLTAVDLASAPSTTSNRNVAVQNLFYLNNVVHDRLYAVGFDEAAGNFQGNDPVNAEAQDGSGTDNANFSTPTDGSSPRMQMYLWSGAGPDHYLDVSGGPTYGAHGAEFGPALTTSGFAGAIAAVKTGTALSDGCGTVSGVSGKIALVARGNCDFTVKVMNAQNAGATGVVVANNAGTTESFTMGGTSRKIRIPAIMIGHDDGDALAAMSNATGTMRKSSTAPLQIDGDIDADVVFHEYGHGLTWRMIGNMSGPIAGALGEGCSDTVAFLLNGDDRIGEYAYSSPLGIRRYAYEGYPLSYGAMNSGEVHNDGELMGAIMWKLRGLYIANGLTSDDLLADWVRSMNYIPSAPSYENMRDGMLQSTDASRDCLVWQAYASFGVGQGSRAVIRGSRVTITESFTKPATCQ
jgi:extracellular elastinolytic metalloproteinase